MIHEDPPHEGVHVEPDASVAVQSPGFHSPSPPGASDASHALAAQVAAVSDPAMHEDVPETV
jgi:hypothetical protein